MIAGEIRLNHFPPFCTTNKIMFRKVEGRKLGVKKRLG
jgi:hypothetical protein